MEVLFSTDPSVERAIRRQGSHEISFIYEDMLISYKLIQDAVRTIIKQGNNQVCLQGEMVSMSLDGISIEVSPMLGEDGHTIRAYPPGGRR